MPHADTLRSKYIPAIGRQHLVEVQDAVKEKPVVIMCDETTDRKGQCVFVVLIRPLISTESPKTYVGGVKILENATAAECARAVLNVVVACSIDYSNVIAIVTDSARYMGACVESLRVPFSENMVHMQCWAHKFNILAGMWSDLMPKLNAFISESKILFLNTRKRKHRYMSFLKEKYSSDQSRCTLFPAPVLTRWNSWFKAVEYVKDHASDIRDFSSSLQEGSSSVMYMKNISDNDLNEITASASFLIEHCKPVIEIIHVLK